MDCPNCDKKFSTRSNLVRHIKNIHRRREDGSSVAKKPKLDRTGVHVFDNPSNHDGDEEVDQRDGNVSDNSREESPSLPSKTVDDSQSDKNESDNNDRDQKSEGPLSDSDSDSIEVGANEKNAWKWLAYKAAKSQNGKTPSDILNLVNESSTRKLFMADLENVFSNHRRVYDYLIEGDIFIKLLSEEGHLEENGYGELEAQRCAWRKRKFLIMDYINEIFQEEAEEADEEEEEAEEDDSQS